MCDAMPGWRRRMLSGGTDPAEVTDTPPEGFVRLPPIPSQLTDHSVAPPRGGGVVFSLVAMGTVALAVVQTLVPWGPWRVALQVAGTFVMFGGLGVWTRLHRRSAGAEQPCACERPPVWIRVVPSIAKTSRTPVEDQRLVEPMPRDAEETPVVAKGVTR